MPTYPLKKLGEICDIVNGSTPLRTNKEYWENGTMAWFTIEDIRLQGRRISETRQKISKKALKETSVRLLPVNTILLCCTASIGEYAITKIPLTTNQQFNGLIIKDSSKVNPDYLFHFCSTLKDALMKVSGKTTIDFIPISRLKEIQIPLPPLSVQEEIVVKLDAALASIDEAKIKTQQALDATRELWESTLEGAFRGCDGWEEKRLADIAKIKGGKRVPKGKKLTHEITSYPYIRVADFLDSGTVDLSGIKYITHDIYEEIKNYTISARDMYISIAGTIGKTGIIPAEIEGANLTENACKLVFKSDVDNKFVYLFSQSKSFFQQAGANTRTTAMPKLALSRLENIKLFIPPLSEQAHIVAHLDAVRAETDRLASLYKQKLADLDELRRSVLQEAFAQNT